MTSRSIPISLPSRSRRQDPGPDHRWSVNLRSPPDPQRTADSASRARPRPAGGRARDQFVTVTITPPRRLTPEQRELLEELQKVPRRSPGRSEDGAVGLDARSRVGVKRQTSTRRRLPPLSHRAEEGNTPTASAMGRRRSVKVNGPTEPPQWNRRGGAVCRPETTNLSTSSVSPRVWCSAIPRPSAPTNGWGSCIRSAAAAMSACTRSATSSACDRYKDSPRRWA